MNGGAEEAVLITGVYGSGKSAVAQEIADLPEEREAPYALLDLDFHAWKTRQARSGRRSTP